MKRILIVDDDQDHTFGLRSLLKSRYEVDIASNGFTAIAKVRRRPFDLVLLDLIMPGLDGAGFLQEVRSDRTDLPIVLISGHRGLARGAAALGIDHFYLKPVDFTSLEQGIQGILGS